MASFISKLREDHHVVESDPEVQAERDKYRLLVTAGPEYDRSTHKTVRVNTEIPTTIENDFMVAKIVVRVKGFRGLPSSSPSTSAEYFADPMHAKDQYSLGFSFVPKRDIPSVDTVWGNDFDHPVRDKLPPGFNTAFRIVKEFIDPGLSCDAYADEPWLYGPSLSCWFALRIGEIVEEGQDFWSPSVLHEGADGTGQDLRDKLGLPTNNEKRRKYFLDAKNRQSFVFEKGRVYSGDFYNPYLDFGNFALKLPGFSLKVIKYVGDKTHCLRYVFKNPVSGEMYFNVNFTLLWGDQLQNALVNDDEDLSREEATPVSGSNPPANDGTAFKEEQQQPHASRGPSSSQQRKVEGSTADVPPDTTAATTTMQLHPGDHDAIAQNISQELAGKDAVEMEAKRPSLSKDPPVDEIATLLQQTSTSQQTGGPFLR